MSYRQAYSMMTRTFLVTSLAILAGSISLRADDLTARLSEYMDAAVKVEQFNGSVLVAKEGKILLEKGYGLANVEHEVPNTPETKFRLGSITKQFTATAILILQDRGKLQVADPINKYLPDAPPAWEAVTIHHLLTHTSRIPSYTDDPTYPKRMNNPETTESMIARFRDKPLEFEPGSTFHYDNSGYFLLGVIIERVSGKSYEAFLKEEIFEPLGMKDSGYDRFQTILSKRAAGYERRGDRLANAQYLDMSQPFSAGSLYSTVGDLYRWDRALNKGKPLSETAMKTMYTPFKNDYAYGWSVREIKGKRQIGHGGGINGFATDLMRFPDDDLFVAVLSNIVPSNPSKVSRDLARIARGEEVKAPAAQVAIKVDPKIFDQYVGRYEVSPTIALTISRDGDRLMMDVAGQGKAEIFPESESEYFLKVVDLQLSFVKENEKVTHVVIHQNGNDQKAKRVEADSPKEKDALEVRRDLAYSEPKNERHTLDVYFRSDRKDRPIVFWIHGGGWQRGDKTDVLAKPQALVDRGFVFASTNYRFVPDVTIHEMAGDVAKSIRWVHDHAAEFGGDPQTMFIMGHSAGAQLAALVSTDERYLKKEGLSLSMIKGCVPVDGDTYDVPMQIATVEERRAEIYKRKFGSEEQQKDLSPVTHVARDKSIPPFLVLHVADHPETTAQSKKLAEVLQQAGISANAFPAEGKDHTTINADLGTTDDKATKALFDFLDKALEQTKAKRD